jgi:hypothetical protein
MTAFLIYHCIKMPSYSMNRTSKAFALKSSPSAHTRDTKTIPERDFPSARLFASLWTVGPGLQGSFARNPFSPSRTAISVQIPFPPRQTFQMLPLASASCTSAVITNPWRQVYISSSAANDWIAMTRGALNIQSVLPRALSPSVMSSNAVVNMFDLSDFEYRGSMTTSVAAN